MSSDKVINEAGVRAVESVANREIQSVEVSCFVQATEDKEKIREQIQRNLGILSSPEEEALEGHFGNPIVHLRWHLTGEDAWSCFGRLAALLGDAGRAELRASLASYLDEHGALYLRLNKQVLMSGMGVMTTSDPVRVKVKPRGFMMKGSPDSFYERLLERERS